MTYDVDSLTGVEDQSICLLCLELERDLVIGADHWLPLVSEVVAQVFWAEEGSLSWDNGWNDM